MRSSCSGSVPCHCLFVRFSFSSVILFCLSSIWSHSFNRNHSLFILQVFFLHFFSSSAALVNFLSFFFFHGQRLFNRQHLNYYRHVSVIEFHFLELNWTWTTSDGGICHHEFAAWNVFFVKSLKECGLHKYWHPLLWPFSTFCVVSLRSKSMQNSP